MEIFYLLPILYVHNYNYFAKQMRWFLINVFIVFAIWMNILIKHRMSM